jgi:hypothetical protein
MSTFDPKLEFNDNNNKYTIIPTCPDNSKLDANLKCINDANLSKIPENGNCGPNKGITYLYDRSKMCYGDVINAKGKNDKGMSASNCPGDSSKNNGANSGVRDEMCVINLSRMCRAPNTVDIEKKTCMSNTPSGPKSVGPTCPPNSSLYQNKQDKRYFCA